MEAIQRYARSAWDVQRLAYIRGIAVAAAVAGWRASRSLLPLLRELVGLPDTAVRQALASQLTPMGTFAVVQEPRHNCRISLKCWLGWTEHTA